MSRPVLTRRRLVSGGAAMLGAAAIPAGVIEAVAADTPCAVPVPPVAFDAVTFLADLKAAGCRVHLALPATVFRPEDNRSPFFIALTRGSTTVMAKWSDAMEACQGHADLEAARLVEMNRWAA